MALKEKVKLGKLVAKHKTTGEILKEVEVPKDPRTYSPHDKYPSNSIDVFDVNDVKGSEWSSSSFEHPGNYELTLIDCETDDPNILSWVKVTIPSGTYLICDRILFYKTFGAWSGSVQYSNYPYIGVVHNLKDVEYTSVNLTAGEWTQIMDNSLNIEGLPIPTDDDKNSLTYPSQEIVDAKYDGEHNQFWNWYGAKTQVSNYSSDYQTFIGGKYPNDSESLSMGSGSNKTALRPILKITPYNEMISGEDANLGDKLDPFQYTYSITRDYEDNDLVVIITIDDDIIDSYTSKSDISNKVIDISHKWDNLEFGTHQLMISTTKSSRIITFKKVINRPDLLPEKPSMNDVAVTVEKTSNYIDYLCSEGVEGIANIIHKII